MSAEALIVRLKRERNEAVATIERLTRELTSHIDYSIDLQRIIEDLCAGGPIREPKTSARHHYNMAVKALAEVLEEALRAQPSTSDPDESPYDRGFFDGVQAHARAIRALEGKARP